MFECNREQFLKSKGILNAPSFSELQNFYQSNIWRIEEKFDPEAFNCYERLYYFWLYYSEKKETNFSLIGLALIAIFIIGKN